MIYYYWKLWAKSLGEKASDDSREADIVAGFRTVIVLVNNYMQNNTVCNQTSDLTYNQRDNDAFGLVFTIAQPSQYKWNKET